MECIAYFLLGIGGDSAINLLCNTLSLQMVLVELLCIDTVVPHLCCDRGLLSRSSLLRNTDWLARLGCSGLLRTALGSSVRGSLLNGGSLDRSVKDTGFGIAWEAEVSMCSVTRLRQERSRCWQRRGKKAYRWPDGYPHEPF